MRLSVHKKLIMFGLMKREGTHTTIANVTQCNVYFCISVGVANATAR